MKSNKPSLSEDLLLTPRLTMAPLKPADAVSLQPLASRREIADTTISIPHPLSEATARDWIRDQVESDHQGQSTHRVLRHRSDAVCLGCICLRGIDQEHLQAELSLWIAVEFWGKGYGTEATRAVVALGFEGLGLNRIHAHHMVRNPGSGRVLEKVGFQREGLLRQRVIKWGVFEDVILLGLLKREASWTTDHWREITKREAT